MQPGRFLLVLAVLATALPAHAQQVVGRLLSAAGEVVAQRAGRDVSLEAGAAVNEFDVLRTGAESGAQIRFVDESIVAMRANSTLRVSEFKFTGRDDGISRAIFDLLRGGLRTVTGLIGRSNRDRYGMRTTLATVGIRGTGYSLVVCNQDCVDNDGSPAPDGSYGVVFEGRIAVSNAGGTNEFGVDEAFFVLDANTAPQLLVARPGFLRDRLEARARRERREQAEQRAAASRDAPPRLTAAELKNAGPGVDRTVQIISPFNAPVIAVASLQDGSGNVAIFGAGLGAGVGFADQPATLGVVDGGQGTVIEVNRTNGYLDRFNFSGVVLGDRGNEQVLDSGKFEGDGGAAWGRWTPGAAVQVNGVTGRPASGVHFFYGQLTPAAAFAPPASADATAVSYAYAGGTRPTDGQGNAGQFLAGLFTVNILQRTLGGDLSYNVNNVTYQLPVPAGTAITNNRGFVGFNFAAVNSGSWAAAGNNTSGALDRYSVSGQFLGSRAQGLGVTFATNDSRVGQTAGVGLFRCAGPNCK